MSDHLERAERWFAMAHDFMRFDCLAYVGSHSHGTYVPPTDPDAIDDVDLMGVALPPARFVVGVDTFDHWVCQREELDIVVYSLHKFVGLLLKGNPNVLGLLWLREQDYLLRSPLFDRLIAHRGLFAAKSVYASFAGYASGQLARMTSYSPLIQHEIDNLTADLDAAGWHLNEVMDRRPVPMPHGLTPDEANAKADRLRHLRAKYHAAYMGEKRRGLVVRHGYDTKNAAHLIRLLVMCEEFMQTGDLHVYRTHDAERLRAIKRGEWTLDAVKEHAEAMFARVKLARDASALPDQPDRRAVSDLLADMTLRAFSAA